MNTAAQHEPVIIATEADVAELHSAIPLPSSEAQQDEDPWGVWPYVWFIDLHAFCCERFHSFHRRLSLWRLGRRNRCQQKQFWAHHSYRPTDDEMGLELL